jgi:hypothetical protein
MVMTMTPAVRKLALVAHVVTSVGWLGAAVAYLGIAVMSLNGSDPFLVRAGYQLMFLLGWYVIVPFALAAVVAGLVQSLGTRWGLLRYYWVTAKFALATIGAIILLQHMTAVGEMADIAAGAVLALGDFRQLRVSLVIHPAGGVILLLAATVLSVYKPWGLTAFGKRLAENAEGAANRVAVPASSRPKPAGTPRWPIIVGAHAVGLAALAALAHIVIGVGRGH